MTLQYSLNDTALQLSDLRCMPAKPVARRATARFLEVRLTVKRGSPVRSVLAFRMDSDRQGESGDVEFWPAADDPRTLMVLSGLLAGLAGKLCFYTAEGVEDYTATIRAMCAFVARKRCPLAWWLRPLALQLMRAGAHLPCFPSPLRAAAMATQ